MRMGYERPLVMRGTVDCTPSTTAEASVDISSVVNPRREATEELTVKNFQGIYLSPQQAKALWNVLGHNLAQYEQAFGAITLEQLPQSGGPVN